MPTLFVNMFRGSIPYTPKKKKKVFEKRTNGKSTVFKGDVNVTLVYIVSWNMSLKSRISTLVSD